MKFLLYIGLFIALNFKGHSQNFYGMVRVDTNLWMDQAEISNGEYRQFIFWVRDSIARKKLTDNGFQGFGEYKSTLDTNIFHPTWNKDIPWDQKYDSITIFLLTSLYLDYPGRFYNDYNIDTKKLNFTINKRDTSYDINVYPDTLCWKSLDSSVNYRGLYEYYFWHPAYDNYPIIGLNIDQMKAFCQWRSALLNEYNNDPNNKKANHYYVRYDLPTKGQWNSVANFGTDKTDYPGNISDPFKPKLKSEQKFQESNAFLINTSDFFSFTPYSKSQWKLMVETTKTYGNKYKYFNSKKNVILGLAGNIAEVTLDGKILGGSWYHPTEYAKKNFEIEHDTSIPTAWSGFRCVVHILEK
jgi:formylglycine-generating enzyme required for sulfatase activity